MRVCVNEEGERRACKRLRFFARGDGGREREGEGRNRVSEHLGKGECAVRAFFRREGVRWLVFRCLLPQTCCETGGGKGCKTVQV